MTLLSVNEDMAKALAKLGYPQIEEGEKPSNLLQRCITCVTKRLKKLTELMPSSKPGGEDPGEKKAPTQAGDAKDAKDAKAALEQKTRPYVQSKRCMLS